jgi:hypothetical protein
MLPIVDRVAGGQSDRVQDEEEREADGDEGCERESEVDQRSSDAHAALSPVQKIIKKSVASR